MHDETNTCYVTESERPSQLRRAMPFLLLLSNSHASELQSQTSIQYRSADMRFERHDF